MATKEVNTKASTEEVTEAPIKKSAKTAGQETPIVAKDIDPGQYVTVRNGFQGTLVYKSSRTGEKFVWSNFGDEQEMELRELRNAKNSSKKFFINNWFMFDEGWIVDYLGLKQYYKNAIKVEDFDELFKKSASELKKALEGMSKGQKKSVAYRAAELIKSGEIDSRKTISILEEGLGVELIEK